MIVTKKTGRQTEETRWYLSSLEPAALTPRQWLARIRGHWMVENGNHYRRDATWREDQERGRCPRRACNLALLRAALLGPLLCDGPINLARVTQRFAFRPSAALRFLFSAHPHL